MKVRVFFGAAVCLLLVPFFIYPQQSVRGVVKDSTNKPIPSASIVLKTQEGSIASYSITGAKGDYAINIPAGIQTGGLSLEASCLGYKKSSVIIRSFDKPVDFVLQNSSIYLPAAVVKDNRPRLSQKGDTLSYRTADFSSSGDRVIGDVLKKLPGVEVADDGKIRYNGKAISNFYIDGDNLLDDKYNIATRTIPNDAVDKIQIIENDQPVKMLRKNTFSDNVAMNIQIKDDAKLRLMGQVKAGGGLPGKYDEDVNAILLRNKLKAINYVKANNTGDDPSNDLISHNLSDYLKRLDNAKPSPFLSAGSAGTPNLPENRYLFNHAALFNFNDLIKPAKDVQVKAGLYYMYDRISQNYNKYSEIYLPADTIRYSEYQDNSARPDLFHAQFDLTINKDKYYLANTLFADYSPSGMNAGMTTNGIPLRQKLKQQPLDLSNEFNAAKTTPSGKIYGIYSYLNVTRRRENLLISPGINSGLFNERMPYEGLAQHIKMPAFYTNNYFSYKSPLGKILQSYKAGLSWQSQQLKSALTALLTDNNERGSSPDSSVNNLNWERLKLYIEPGYEYLTDKVKISASLPLSFLKIHYLDDLYSLNGKKNGIYFNPSLSIKYQTGVENYITASYSFMNTPGTSEDIYRGNILANYRTLYANNSLLPEKENYTLSLGYNYRKAIKIFFFSLLTSYSKTKYNTISSIMLTDDFQRRVALPFENTAENYMASGSISNYSFKLRTTFSSAISYQLSKSFQLQNDELLPYSTVIAGIKGAVQSKISNSINFSYSSNLQQISSSSPAVTTGGTKMNQLTQNAGLFIAPAPPLVFSVSGEHLFTRQKSRPDLNYLFTDLSAAYKLNKIKADIELGIRNLMNVKDYKAAWLSANTFTSSSYTIPGRMAFLKATFNF